MTILHFCHEPFPHVYGPVPVAAVVAVHPFPPGPDGRLSRPPGVG